MRSSRARTRVCWLSWFAAVAGLATACPATATAQATAVPSPTASAPALQPGDAAKLSIWREPDLSGIFRVNENGDVVFPKIGTVHVAGMPGDSLKRLLTSSYATFLRDPSIGVTLLRRVMVSGFVRTPGLYDADATMTVADVVALAGGAAPDGKADVVELVRNGRRVTDNLSRQTRIAESPLRSGDQLYVPQRSWLSRNAALVASVIGTAGVIIATAARN